MFRDTRAFSSFSVKNLEQAREFYGRNLGLDMEERPMGLLELKLKGGGRILVYQKEDHAPGTFTILNFPVANIEEALKELKKKGIEPEHYEGDIKTDEHGIFRGSGIKIAWFKDPSGNIFSILEEEK